MVQVEEEHTGGSAISTSQRNRLSDPVVQQYAIRQIGNSVVLSGVRHFERHSPRSGDIMENDHLAGDVACSVVDRSRGIFNEKFRPVAAQQDVVGCRGLGAVLRDAAPLAKSGLARIAIDNLNNFGQGPAGRFFVRPARHSLRDHVKKADISAGIRASNRIGNTVERNLGAFLLHEQRFFQGLAVADIGVGAEPARHLSFRIPNRNRSRKEPAVVTVTIAEGERVFPGFATEETSADAVRNPLHMVWMMDLFSAPTGHLL